MADYNLIYQNSRYEVRGKEGDGLYLHEFKPFYATLVVLHEGRLVVVRQYRAAVEREVIELPGGRLEGEESPEEAVRRELREETGLIAGEMISLGQLDNYACMLNRRAHFFFTSDIIAVETQDLDEDEDIEVLTVPVEEAFESLRTGKWVDSELAAALLLCRLHGLL